MVNWKTTLCGALAALASFLKTQPGVLATIGAVLEPVAIGLLGYFAADGKAHPPAP